MSVAYYQETQTGMLYQPRGVGWGVRWERVSKGRGYICIPMAESCWGLTENSKILSNHPSIKKKIFFFEKSNTGSWDTWYCKSKCPEAETTLACSQIIIDWSTMNEERVVRDGMKRQQEQIRKISRNGKNRVCLPAWNFCLFPTVRLSTYHHQLAPNVLISIQWHLGSDMPHDSSSVLRHLIVSCHILMSLVRSLGCVHSGLTQVQLNSGTDSIAQRCLCYLTFIRFPDFNRLKPSARRKRDA